MYFHSSHDSTLCHKLVGEFTLCSHPDLLARQRNLCGQWVIHASWYLWTAGSVPHSYRHRHKHNLEQSQAHFNYSSCLKLKSGTWYIGTDNEPDSQTGANQPWKLQRKAVLERRKSKPENNKTVYPRNTGYKMSGKHPFIQKYWLKLKESRVILP